MKSLTAITGPDAQYDPSLKERLLRGTATRLCPNVGIVTTKPVIMTGAEMVSPVEDLRGRMANILGPLYVLYLYLLRLFGFDNFSADKLAELEALNEEAKGLSDHALYWQRAIAHMLGQAAQHRAAGRKYKAPEWFIWLTHLGVGVAPSRLRALMACWSVTGRAAVMGLATQTASARRDAACASAKDADIRPVLWGLNPRVYAFTGGHDPTAMEGYAPPPHGRIRFNLIRLVLDSSLNLYAAGRGLHTNQYCA